MTTMEHKEYKIGGVSVHFPCKPYPSQFSMMDKIIKGLERSQNCLLESPTGSGKSLALLCSALAWQRSDTEKRDKEEERKQKLLDNADSGVSDCLCECHIIAAKKKNKAEAESKSSYFPSTEETQACATSTDQILDADEDDDFKSNAKSFRTPGSVRPGLAQKLRKHVSISYEDSPQNPPTVAAAPSLEASSGEDMKSPDSVVRDCGDCDCGNIGKSKKRKIPKIFFGTRTHKQVAQIVRELKKTVYSDVSMTILGSREHTCIHPEVSRMGNKNEGCQELLKGPGCRFKDRAKNMSSQEGIRRNGLETAWDLEDMVMMCKKRKACPYFLTRALKEQCEIIICPYNYLVDPIIRESMEINLKGQIIILDEGHNIEDSSREAGSQTVKQEAVQKATHDLLEMVKGGVDVNESILMENVMTAVNGFINQYSDNLDNKDFDQSYKIWSGFDIVAQMERLGLGPVQYAHVKKAFQKLCEDKEEVTRNAQGEELRLSNPASTAIEQLMVVLDFMYRNDMKFVEDYRLSIVKSTSFVADNQTNAAWLNPRHRHGGQRRVPVVSCTFNFWCMNPAVAFSDFQNCRTVVLSSGTLSPMSSFSSELGMNFSIQLEANHVIKDNQVWVGAIGQGPTGTSLQAVYRNIETYNFQDELGQLVHSVCKTVPHGVLCFFPSYKCLEKLSNRWKTTELWDKMAEHKKIVAEPRGSDKMNFEELMQLFYQAVEEEDDDQQGALFLAVCRGKVSEGLDFADNFARAVITVGIPYPNFKDVQVDLKRKYNDLHKSSRGLLSGSDWYEIQAYRALNQALGRCIRHRKDWGALILVDERFVKNPQKYTKGLSKWVRNKTVTYNTFGSAMDSLVKFTNQRIEAMKTEEAEESFIHSTPFTPGACDISSACTQLLSNSVVKEVKREFDTSAIDTSVQLTPDLGLRTSRRTSLESTDLKTHQISDDVTPQKTDIKKSQTFLFQHLQTSSKKSYTKDTKTPVKSMECNEKRGSNKFFKFCNIEKRQGLGGEKDENNCPNGFSCEANGITPAVDVQDRTSPVLLENCEPESNTTVDLKCNKENSESGPTRKPLFRRRSKSDADCAANVDVSHESPLQTKLLNGSEKVEGEKEEGIDSMDDLEGLMVRRRTSRQKKRKSDVLTKLGSKRSRGVDFLDDLPMEVKQEESQSKEITCCICGHLLLKVTEFEKRKRLPPFMKAISKGSGLDVLFLPSHDLEDSVQVLSSSLEKGVTLDCHYDETSGIVLQYLGCSQCDDQRGIGCRVLHTTTTSSQFLSGQTWFLADHVKLS